MVKKADNERAVVEINGKSYCWNKKALRLAAKSREINHTRTTQKLNSYKIYYLFPVRRNVCDDREESSWLSCGRVKFCVIRFM